MRKEYWSQSAELQRLCEALQGMRAAAAPASARDTDSAGGFLERHLPRVFAKPFQLPLARQFAVRIFYTHTCMHILLHSFIQFMSSFYLVLSIVGC